MALVVVRSRLYGLIAVAKRARFAELRPEFERIFESLYCNA
jgi:hypothetical protein